MTTASLNLTANFRCRQ